MRRALAAIGAALLAGSLVTGCQVFGIRDRAPAGFHDTACKAYDHLAQAWDYLVVTGDDYANIDAADQWLAGIPEWEPGAMFVIRLREMRNAVATAAVDQAARDVITSSRSLRDLADTEYRGLYDRHGFTCPLTPVQLPSPS